MPAEKGYVYILTNPSFPDYVKIGSSTKPVEERVRELNRTECTPFAFRIYAVLEVPGKLKDLKLHNLIDKLNPGLRSIDKVDGKIRKREFYAMPAEDAYDILEAVAEIFSAGDKLKHWTKTQEETAEEKDDTKAAEKISKLAKNRHHIKEVEFSCSLTGHRYKSRASTEGTLEIVDLNTGEVVPNNSKPSKLKILGSALEDLGLSLDGVETTYQRYRLLQKTLLKK